MEGTQPGGEAALDALSDVPVADSQRPEWGQTPQCVLWQDGFWVIHQLQAGQRWAAVPRRSYRAEEEEKSQTFMAFWCVLSFGPILNQFIVTA